MRKLYNYDNDIKENINKHNLNWPQLPHHLYRILLFGGSGSRKTKTWLNLIKQQDNDNHSIIDKTYLYIKDSNDAKYQYFIKKCKYNCLKNPKDLKAFIERSNNMQNIYENIKEYKYCRKCNVLIVFDDMITDMISNIKLSPIITELFFRRRKLNISTVFITSLFFKYQQMLNCTHFFYYENSKQTRALTNGIYLFIRSLL